MLAVTEITNWNFFNLPVSVKWTNFAIPVCYRIYSMFLNFQNHSSIIL